MQSNLSALAYLYGINFPNNIHWPRAFMRIAPYGSEEDKRQWTKLSDFNFQTNIFNSLLYSQN